MLLQANAIGRSAKTVREFLEKHYSEEVSSTEKESIKLALKALLEVVQSGSKNMEIAIMRRNEPLKVSNFMLNVVYVLGTGYQNHWSKVISWKMLILLISLTWFDLSEVKVTNEVKVIPRSGSFQGQIARSDRF